MGKAQKGWLEKCVWCGKKHVMTMQTCPKCGVYEVAQPKSEKIKCMVVYQCDGCEAYAEHTNPY